jgi:hypothetical protein
MGLAILRAFWCTTAALADSTRTFVDGHPRARRATQERYGAQKWPARSGLKAGAEEEWPGTGAEDEEQPGTGAEDEEQLGTGAEDEEQPGTGAEEEQPGTSAEGPISPDRTGPA